MKALILCAGYATRLYPLTLNQPKHLLPIANRPMLNHTMDKIEKIQDIDEIYLVTNEKFFNIFNNWAKTIKTTKKIVVFNDKTSSDETKIGAIGDIKFVIDSAKVQDDFLILAGDNLFEFRLTDFILFFKSKHLIIALYDVKNLELMKKYGEVQLDSNGKLVSFREKPQEPKTTLAATCAYLFSKEKLHLIDRYLKEGNNPDQPGRYIQWLYKIEPVYGFVFKEKWYDIGDINQYKIADEDYKKI